MVNATVDNTPVAINLSDGQSTTVPSNEVWKVNISTFPVATAGNRQKDVRIKVSNVTVAGGKTRGETDAGASADSSLPLEMVLVGGETIKIEHSGGDGMRISGFIVNS